MISPTQSPLQFISGTNEFSLPVQKDAAQWLLDLRREASSRFSELGIPTTKQEEWKYTNVEFLAKEKFERATTQTITEIADFNQYRDSKEINIVFVNGFFSAEHSNITKLPKGIRIVELNNAAVGENTALASLFSKFHTKSDESFSALNTAFFQHGVFIKFDDKIASKEIIHIIHVASSPKNQNMALFPRTAIFLGPSSEAEIIESHIAFSSSCYFANALTDIYLSENAKLQYQKIQNESLYAYHIGTTRVFQERNSQLESFILSIGARLTRNNLNVILNEEGAHATLNGLYAVSGNQHVDNHTTVDHRPPNCTSTQLYKGILDGNSRAVFNGKIFVRQEAQKTNSYQLNKNLLLGSGCQVDTKPQLEIFADDVKCTHGATIGQLNEEELFYLQARAIPKPLAVKMLARGFVNDILNRINNESAHARMDKLLTTSFAALK